MDATPGSLQRVVIRVRREPEAARGSHVTIMMGQALGILRQTSPRARAEAVARL